MSIVNKEIERLQIEAKMKALLGFEKAPEFSLEWGMNHILFAPSKRIRPLLVLESNLVFSECDEDVYILAALVELIHTYSLIHDDLPCMDNDELRRGVKTLHTVRDEGYAVLTGDALLTRGYEMLAGYRKLHCLPAILTYIADKAGYRGMILGQALDLEGEGKKLSLGRINEINQRKTSCLLQLSMMLGAVNGTASEKEVTVMEELGGLIGELFQIRDDILDIVGNPEVIGKNVGSDEKNGKSSIPLILGMERAERIMQEKRAEAQEKIERLPGNRVFFEKFLNFLIERES